MKRLIFALPAFVLFAAFLPEAQAASEQCRMIREAMVDVPPVSSYTANVLARADRGIAYARGAAADPEFARYLPGWARSVGSAWAGLLDSQIQRTMEERELPRVTACLHFDMLLIDCKMEEVGEEMKAQLSRGSFAAILRLESLLSFLNERRRHLQLGALDPLYSDPTWGQRYLFDPPENVWCCPGADTSNTCTQQSYQSCEEGGGVAFYEMNACTAWGCKAPEGSDPDASLQCPYSSDYAPAFQSGFGCDLDVMSLRSAYPPVRAELEGLQIITDQINRYRDLAQQSQEIQREIDGMYGETTELPPEPGPREHLTAYGCGWTAGYCSDDLTVKCLNNDECDGKGTCVMPVKVCDKNRVIRCFIDSQCGGSGPCVDGEEPPAARELRGPFSLDKDQVSILSEFLGLRAQQEISREYNSDLKTPSEFLDTQEEERDARAAEERNPFLRLFRSSVRLTVRVWNRIQGREEAFIFPQAVDAQLEVANALTSLRGAVSTLSRLSSERDGVRSFVGSFAYFIRRTCVYRPCSLMLDQVIRIVTSDECFPYTNGEYLGDTEDSPRWEKCKAAMGL